MPTMLIPLSCRNEAASLPISPAEPVIIAIDMRPRAVAALYEGVNELQGRVFPSSERRGGCAIKKMLRSLLMKAQTGWSFPDDVTTSAFTIMTTPSAPLRRLRTFFLPAQPPLLFQEGNTLSWQFIHTFYERRFSAVVDRRCS